MPSPSFSILSLFDCVSFSFPVFLFLLIFLSSLFFSLSQHLSPFPRSFSTFPLFSINNFSFSDLSCLTVSPSSATPLPPSVYCISPLSFPSSSQSPPYLLSFCPSSPIIFPHSFSIISVFDCVPFSSSLSFSPLLYSAYVSLPSFYLDLSPSLHQYLPIFSDLAFLTISLSPPTTISLSLSLSLQARHIPNFSPLTLQNQR